MAELKTLNGYEIVDQTARTNIDDINKKMPGRNLLSRTRTFDSHFFKVSQCEFITDMVDNFTVAAKSTAWNFAAQKFYAKKGDILTFSVYVYAKNGIDFQIIAVASKVENEAKYEYLKGPVSGTNDNFERLYITLKITSSGFIRPGVEAINTNGTLYAYGYKLEYGDTPTEWSPAPEDNIPQVLSGSVAPYSGNGLDGDLYVMY